jgi:hypothetical protein
MPLLSASLSDINEYINNLVNSKKQAVFSDKTLVNEIFSRIKEV